MQYSSTISTDDVPVRLQRKNRVTPVSMADSDQISDHMDGTGSDCRIDSSQEENHQGSGDARSTRSGSVTSGLTWPQIMVCQHQLGIGEPRLVGDGRFVENPFEHGHGVEQCKPDSKQARKNEP